MSRGDRSRPGRERTAEERERDRQERAQRRALRSGDAGAEHADEVHEQEAVHDAGMQDDEIHDEAIDDEATHDEGIHDEAVDEEAVHVHTVHDETAHPDVVQQAAIHHEAVPAAAVHEEAFVQSAPAFESTPEAPEAHEAEPPVLQEPEPAPGTPAEGLPAEPVTMAEEPMETPETLDAASHEPPAFEQPVPAPTPAASQPPPIPPRRPAPPPQALERSRAISLHGRGPRSPLSRLAAVIALVAVVVAVLLLLHSLRSKPTATVAPPPVVKVLIPEGKTRPQIAQIAAADGLKGSYRAASRRSPLLNPAHYGAPAGTPDLEGFLFPATYDMNPGAPVGTLVQEQLTAFSENFGATEIARARALHITPYQLLIVASMVEREAQIPGDRPKIAAVIYNRLREGMPLGIDATIYYAVELANGIPTYTHELSEAQLHINSPYNTRTHVGLPPTPISNPGVASIRAAAYPAHVSYLYYVAGADGCGEQVFSNTLAEFEVNNAAYKAAVSRNGGHPPTCKHG